jgi:hypothetical protein
MSRSQAHITPALAFGRSPFDDSVDEKHVAQVSESLCFSTLSEAEGTVSNASRQTFSSLQGYDESASLTEMQRCQERKSTRDRARLSAMEMAGNKAV